MEEFGGVVSTHKSLGVQKKLVLLGLLLGNFIIIFIAILLTKNKPLPITPRASGPSQQRQQSPQESGIRANRTSEEKIARMAELGVEIAMTEPQIEKVKIDITIDKPAVTIPFSGAVMWTIEDNDEHILSFSDGVQSPPLSKGSVFSRHISGTEAISYSDNNNKQLAGRVDINPPQ